MRDKRRIGDMLVEARLVSEFQVSVAAGRAKNFRTKIGQELVKLGFLNEQDLAFTLEKQLGIKWVSLKDITISSEAVEVMTQEFAEKFFVMPIAADKKSVTIATTEPSDINALDTIRFKLGKSVIPVIATYSDIYWAIDKYYKGITETEAVESTVAASTKDKGKDPKLGFEYKLNTEHLQDLLETLINLLIEKGVINKEEFYKRLESKQ